MLILTRREGQSVQIGDNIVVRVMELNDGSVRLAIDAPREVSILRTELIEAAKVNKAAAQEEASPSALLQFLQPQERDGNKGL